jgi:hypothetical protein
MRKAEVANLKALQKENEDLKKEQFRQSQVLFQLRQKEKELLSEIAGKSWVLTKGISPERFLKCYKGSWQGARDRLEQSRSACV